MPSFESAVVTCISGTRNPIHRCITVQGNLLGVGLESKFNRVELWVNRKYWLCFMQYRFCVICIMCYCEKTFKFFLSSSGSYLQMSEISTLYFLK